MEENFILGPSQHAYRKWKSTQTAWADIDATIQKATDNGKFVGLLLIDMSAAFNLVAKEVIIPKLMELGVGPYAAKLLHTYLTSRKSRTKVKGVYSAWINVRTGIGEGSVLGPLIFILTIVCCTMVLHRAAQRLKSLNYTAEVQRDTTVTKSQIILSSAEFADDVTGLTVCQTEDQVAMSLTIMMEEYEKYFSAHGLKINVSKCEHMVIGGQRTRQIIINGRVEAQSVKLLGLTFTNHYKFDKHVDTVVEKMARRNGELAKLSGLADQQTMKMLANATVLSIASFGSHVYATNVKQQNRIQVKINKAMRLITASKLRVHIADLQKMTGWLKFTEMVMVSKITLLHKIMITSAAPVCKLMITEAPSQTRYSIRDREIKVAWRPKMQTRGAISFIQTAVKLYNQIKIVGKKVPNRSLSKFIRSAIKSWR